MRFRITAALLASTVMRFSASAFFWASPSAAMDEASKLEVDKAEGSTGQQGTLDTSKLDKTVCGTAPTLLQHQPGSCSSPYDAPPSIPPTCSYKLVEIVTYVWTPPVLRWIPKIVGWVHKLIKGVPKAFPITERVAEEVEGGYWEKISERVQRLWCSS